MSRLSAGSWLPLPSFLQTCGPGSWPSRWHPQDHSDNERKCSHQLPEAGGSGLQLQVLPAACLTRALHLSRQSSALPCEPADATRDVPFWWLGNAHSLSRPALLPR